MIKLRMNCFFLIKTSNLKESSNIQNIVKSKLSPQQIRQKSKFQSQVKTGTIYLLSSLDCEEDGVFVLKSIFLSHQVNKYNPNSYYNQYDLSKSIKYYINKKGITSYFICFLINKANEVIPVGVFHPYFGSFEDEISFYFSVLSSAQNLGIATAMTQGFISGIQNWKNNPSHEYYEEIKDIKRIEVSLHYENIASLRVFEKLHFKKSEIISVLAFKKGYKFTKEI